tara:strand:- start:103 stop:333 length:231 start_codon:yes stop_codon:yes gene_type:complete
MSSSPADELRADIREAYEQGDLTQAEYLAELRKLRENTTSSAGQRASRAGRGVCVCGTAVEYIFQWNIPGNIEGSQ